MPKLESILLHDKFSTTVDSGFDFDQEQQNVVQTPKSEISSDTAYVPQLAYEGAGQDIEPSYILPPVDGGWRAWVFLAAATYIVLLVWGMPCSVGVLHVYWINSLFSQEGSSTLTLAATLQTGLLYMSAAIAGPMFTSLPKWRRTFQIGGFVAASISLIASAFATKPWHILLTFGCIYPLAGISYLPCATLVFEWFHARRGLATGIMYAGTGVGGTIFPFLINSLLDKFGYKAAMVSLGLVYVVTGSAAVMVMKGRVPVSRGGQGNSSGRGIKRRGVEWLTTLKSKPLLVGSLMILLVSLGNFIPSLWLPSYANALNLSHPSGTGLIALLNAATVPGNALMGYLSDRFSFRTVFLTSSIGSALSCAIFWGFGTNEGMLVVFALIFGLLGPTFCTLWTHMISVISRDDFMSPGIIFALFSVVRGIGNLTCGPVSQALLKMDSLNGGPGAYGRDNYGILLIYASVTIICGGFAGLFFNSN